MTIPYVAYAANSARSKFGLILLILIPALLIIGGEARKIFQEIQKIQQKRKGSMIKKSLLKIVCLLIIVGLNWTGLLAVGETFAFFSDSKDSNANTFTAANLDLSLRSGQNNFVPLEIASNMAPGDSVARDIYVGKTANSLPLRHGVSYEFVSGSKDFCNRLQLKIWYNHYFGPPSGGYDNRDMRLKYNGPLTSLANLTDVDFIIPHPDDEFDTDPIDGTEQWFFYQITFTSGPEIVGQECQFKFVFDGWQDNIENYGDGGFTDKEEIYSTLIDSVFIEEEELVTEDEKLESEEIIENAAEEIPVIEEEPAEEIPAIEEESTEEEVITEENQEQGGIIEEINEIIDEVIDEIVDEIMPDEETGDEVVSEPEVPVIEETLIIEEASADEIPAVDEQPAAVPDDSSSTQDGVGESINGGEISGDSGVDAGGESVSE